MADDRHVTYRLSVNILHGGFTAAMLFGVIASAGLDAAGPLGQHFLDEILYASRKKDGQ